MDPASLLIFVLFIVLLGLSAFFSGSETAYFSLTASNIKSLSTSSKPSEKQAAVLLQDSSKLLITIIIGNTIVNAAIVSLSTLVVSKMSLQSQIPLIWLMIINVFVITFIILLISEIIPKVASSKKPKHFAIAAAYPLTFFYFLFYPLSSFFYALTHGLSGLLKFEKDKYLLSDAELRTLVDVGQEKGALHADERDMIHSIFEMSETMVREIMVPRTDMIVISDDSTLTHVLNTVKDRLHSRIPVYSETIDEIIGILFIKDLLPLIKRRTTSEIDLKKLVHPAYFVPEQKKINELLREFQKEKIHMAIVVDEYGGTSGLVTLEDVIEEIVGEIQDEYDTEQPLIVKLSPEKFLLDAGVSMDELNDELEIQLPCEENTDTLAGFLLGQFGSVPKIKESVRWENYLFTIIKVSNRRIQQVEMRIEEKVNESR